MNIMKIRHILLLAASLVAVQSFAQGKVWRCGNEYTNDASVAQQRGCKIMEGGNVTVVQSPRPSVAAATRTSPPGSPRVESSDQKSRDNEARTVLESELRKAESK